MTRLLLPLALLTGTALAGTFGGFQIKPYGNERLDLGTGLTTLDKGGVATDSKTGLSIDAKTMQYKDGVNLKAQNATLKTREGGTLRAQNTTYDVPTGVLTAQGDLKYGDGRVRDLTADTVQYDSKKGIVIARGNVRVAEPNLRGNLLVADLNSNRAVLYGNYAYASGGTKLSNAKNDATLLITFTGSKSSATTRPLPEALAPFKAYLK
ncbi:hypothetical protein [Deinococcus maricopensis]|nr:hypothetical protein [Deinococcus maricopensis]